MDLVQHIKPLIDWLHLHPGYAGFITFLISFSESIAVIGLIIPGSIVMSAIGTLVGAEIIPAYATMLWAAAGAILGDILSFRVGYRYKTHIKDMWPFKRYPQIITSAEDFFHHHGGKSIFMGRFVGPVRPILPLVAGMLHMNKVRFYISCIIAGTLWAPVYMLPGILIGAASQQLAAETATKFIATVLALLLVLWLTAWFFKWLIGKLIDLIDIIMNVVWHYLKTHKSLRWMCKALQDPNNPEGHGQLTMGLIALFLIITFLLLFYSVSHNGLATIFNQPIHQLCRNIQTMVSTKTSVIISYFGYKYVVAFMGLCVLIYLLIARYFRAAFHWVFVIIASAGTVGVMKNFINSPRPGGASILLGNNSFPSGHTTLSVALYGFLAILIARNFAKPILRKLTYLCFGLTCGLIIFSRIYLGAHWLTDVIAGSILGLIIVLVTTISFRRIPSPKINLAGLLGAVGLGLLIAVPWQIAHTYDELIELYTPYWPTYSSSIEDWWHQSTDTPPLYRPNRIGHPVEVMNIQWAASLDKIKHTLAESDWQEVPKINLVNLVNRVSSSDTEKKVPLISPLYLGQRPTFVAVKRSSQNHVMILRLWSSNVTFTNDKLPLWVGTLTYQIPHQHQFWLHGKYLRQIAELNSPTEELIPCLKGYRFHVLTYDNLSKPKRVPDYQWDGGVLLIRPRH